MSKKLWEPENINLTFMTQFRDFVNAQFSLSLNSYAELHTWSVQCLEQFWSAISTFCQLNFSHNPSHILTPSKRMQAHKWFVGATLNFAQNLLSRQDDHLALIASSEQGEVTSLTYAQLYTNVASFANALRDMGLKPGDRVAAMLPNTPEAVIAMLATTSLGAIWSACSPDFGPQGILDRFLQIEPKIFITVDGHFYKGKRFFHAEKNLALIKRLSSVTHTILFNFLDKNSSLEGAIPFEQCLQNTRADLSFVQLPFDHPLYILYSSGTTGKPKCLVHGAGGTLIQHLKELKLHTNLSENDRIFFNSTVTWMMWHWLISSLALGATLVLYEGSPFYPKTDTFFDLIDKTNINYFGVGAKFFETCANEHLIPQRTHSLDSLRCILTTGSPLLPASFDYIYSQVKKIRVSSIAGGSDIISCFALGNPNLPVYRGEIQCIGLGMDVKIYNDRGHAVTDQKGELVCTNPFPSMPLYFWNDPTGTKYHQAYFDKFENVWTHGDYALITKQGGVIIYGRSDATLNPSGVRIGSSEIYQQLEHIPEVQESLVIGQQVKGNERIILFVILKPGISLEKTLIQKIKTQIKHNTSPYHVPAKIIAVTDIPRTANNKLSEIAVKKIINGESIENTQALINPQCLDLYKNLPELTED